MQKKIARALLSIQAVFLRPQEPFTWASGIKSPIYCDNRLTLSYPKVRAKIENGLRHVIETKYPGCEGLMGTSTAGIPHAAITAHLMNLQMATCAPARKPTGATTASRAGWSRG